MAVMLTGWARPGLSQTSPPTPGRGDIVVVPEEPEDPPPPGAGGRARPAEPTRPYRPAPAPAPVYGEPSRATGGEEEPPALGAPATSDDSGALRSVGPGPAFREEGPFVPGRPPEAAGTALDEEPDTPVTRAGNARPEPVRNPLPPEGKQTVLRRARLERNAATGWSMLNFENEEGAEKLPVGWILPCRLLERMEQMAERESRIVFEVSCDNTIYDSRCFVLLRNVRVARAPMELPADSPPPPLPAAPAAQTPAEPAAQTPATAPAPGTTPPATAPAATAVKSIQKPFVGPSSAEVLQGLLRDRHGTPMVVDDRKATPGERPRVAAPSRAEPSLVLLEHANKMVVNRRAQLIATGNGAWKEIRFVDDNNLQMPPLTVLPSAMLKKAELNQESDLAITGEITVYRGRQFIILHSVEPVLPLGRF
ncbi:MAG: hypothetical protein NTV86_22815 [Planctomycetota bacterium]|nr:hypothetical protein [Planctomycetota bacterium]